MKPIALLAALALTWPLATRAETMSAADKKALHTPAPQYPLTARATGLTGSGVCRVVFGGDGHAVKATMSKSTGSAFLDENTRLWANKYWTGPPGKLILVPIVYRLVASSAGDVHTPVPPYPYQARSAHYEGRGNCRVIFGRDGRAARAVMVKSTGHEMLDQNTVSFALANWTGPPNTAVMLPVTYILH